MKENKRNYEIFSGEDLVIADRIQRLRLNILVHSFIYYRMNNNLVSDRQWDLWAKELVQLQKDYEDISKQVVYSEEFEDFDGTTGAFFQLDDPYVASTAHRLTRTNLPSEIHANNNQKSKDPIVKEAVEDKKPKSYTVKRLF